MSYDIVLQKFINGDAGICTQEEAQACVDLLKTYTSNEPSAFNVIELSFGDGMSVEFQVWKNETEIDGCSVMTRSMSKRLLDFVFKMAKAGNFIIFDTGGSDTPEIPVAIALSTDTLESFGTEIYENPRLCHDVAGLAEILGQSFGGWSDYRDQVTSSDSQKS